MLCLECGEELRSRLQLKHHLRKQHGRMTYEDYLVKHQHGGVRPTCACGCGRETTFQGKGFARLIQGHHTAELRSAQSARMKGKKLTQEHREAIGEALRKSDVAKASAAHRSKLMRDVAVVGGLSRLTKRALGQASIDGMCGLVTYADMRFSSCRGYQSSGYAPVRETQPRFWWTDFVTRRDRFSVRARDGMSQVEVARLERQCRIWGDVNHVYTIDA